MSENAAIPTPAPERPAPPTFEPDPELIGHAEGNPLEERLYRRAAERMRREAKEHPEADG